MKNTTIAAFSATAILFSLPAHSEKSVEFNNGMKHWIDIAGYSVQNKDEFAEWFLETYEWDTWREHRDDEFKFHRIVEETKTEAIDWLNDFEGGSYYIFTGVEFGKYDFDKELFPVEVGISDSTYYKWNGDEIEAPFSAPEGSSHEDLEELPPSLIVQITNPEIFDAVEMKMSPDRAEEFLDNRRDDLGNINRSVWLKFIITPTDATIEDIGNYSDHDAMALISRVEKVDLYADRRQENKLLTIDQ